MSNKDILPIEILYQDAHCAVINKPAHLMVHGDGKATGPFLTDWILVNFPESKGVGETARSIEGDDIERSGIVHRLDRETSGALIVAKTKEGYDSLKAQFQDRTILKKYLALVWGEVQEEFGTINRPIGRSGSDFRKWSAQRGTRGETREAETYWTRLWTGTYHDIPADVSPDLGKRFSLIEAEPKTGRTHQIRVHLTAVNHPVVGDSLYAPKRPYLFGFERLALHSHVVSFTALDGERITVTAPLPEDMSGALKELGIEMK
ncbi:MAG: RluA family pseudouridine synthase [Patescibacteria group bacterium]